MKKFLCLAVLSSILSMNSYADLDLKPKAHIRFYCSQDRKTLMATDGSQTSTIEDSMVIWNDGLPSPGCTQKIVNDITQKGFYCDGHYLADYHGNQEEYADVPSCEAALNAEPNLSWN